MIDFRQVYTIVQSIRCMYFTIYNTFISPPSQHACTIKVGIALGVRYFYRRSKKETTPRMSWAWQICPDVVGAQICATLCPCNGNIGDLVIISPRGGFGLDSVWMISTVEL